MLRRNTPKQSTEEVCQVEVVCTSKEPTTRNKPNTTHAPLRLAFPKTTVLVVTHHKPRGQAGNQKPKRSLECTGRCENSIKGNDENSIGGNRYAPQFQSLVYRQQRSSKVRALDDGHHAVLHPFAIRQSLTTPIRFQYP